VYIWALAQGTAPTFSTIKTLINYILLCPYYKKGGEGGERKTLRKSSSSSKNFVSMYVHSQLIPEV
jgi:hypothetical protein